MNKRTDIATDSPIGEKMSIFQMVEHEAEASMLVGMICRMAHLAAPHPASLAAGTEGRS